MTENENELLMSSIMDIGKLMLVSGAEIYRVEDTIIRLIKAYGGSAWQVTAVPSHIIASARFGDRELTYTRRVDTTQTDLELLDRINALSRRICSEKPEAGKLAAMLESARSGKHFTDVQLSAIYAFTSAAFTLFFGGGWIDTLISAVIAGSLYYVRKLIAKSGGNRIFVALFCSAYSAFLAKLLCNVGLGADPDKVIIGVVMVLIPGVELVNGFRDFSAGDIQAGIMHMGEALFLGVMIAVGAAGMFMLAGSMGL